jgi:tRNA(Arg) A34 adenosine deaminase TadA
MCASAAIWAKLEGIVYGASSNDETPHAHWRVRIPSEYVIKHGDPKLKLYSKFMREECRKLLYLE